MALNSFTVKEVPDFEEACHQSPKQTLLKG